MIQRLVAIERHLTSAVTEQTLWRLWQALDLPPSRHPVYQRVMNRADDGSADAPTVLRGLMLLFAILLLIPLAQILIVVFALLAVINFALIATLYGVSWAMRIATWITREKINGTFDLLAITPDGGLGATWILITANIYHHNAFRDCSHNTNRFRTVMIVVGSLTAVAAFLFSGGTRTDWSEVFELLMLFSVLSWTAIPLSYLNFVQATLVGGLIGAWTGMQGHTTGDARVTAFGLFMLTQVGMLLVLAVASLVVVPVTFDLLALPDGLLRYLTSGAIALLAVYIYSVILVGVLWRRVTGLLDQDGQSMREFVLPVGRANRPR